MLCCLVHWSIEISYGKLADGFVQIFGILSNLLSTCSINWENSIKIPDNSIFVCLFSSIFALAFQYSVQYINIYDCCTYLINWPPFYYEMTSFSLLWGITLSGCFPHIVWHLISPTRVLHWVDILLTPLGIWCFMPGQSPTRFHSPPAWRSFS